MRWSKVTPIFLDRDNWYSEVYAFAMPVERLSNERVIGDLTVADSDDEANLDTPGGVISTNTFVVLEKDDE